MKRYVLDASALMSFLEDRPGAAKVEELLRKAAEGQQFLLMCVLNWGEVFYSLWRAKGKDPAEERMRQVAQLPIELVDVDVATTTVASSFKAAHNLPYVDAFAAALAQMRKASLVTADKDFETIAKEISILWTLDD